MHDTLFERLLRSIDWMGALLLEDEMRVLQLIGSTGFYGAEAVVTTLAQTLPSLGLETYIGHIRYSGDRAGFRLEEHAGGCTVIPIEHNSRVDPGLVLRLRAELKRLGIDAIHSHGYKPDLYGGIAAKLAGIPMLSTCHLWTRATCALRGYAHIDKIALQLFDKVVAVSEPIFAELQSAGIPTERLALIPNQISAERFAEGKPTFRTLFREPVFLFGLACRQVAAKGIDLLIQSAAMVSKLFPDTRFLIAGDGPKAQEYRELARAFHMESKVIFLGRCDAMPDFYASLDVFVLPSLDEGMPIALLEAMASGKPVIASNVGSIDRLVRDKVNGLLIAPGDFNALTVAMLSLASERDGLPQLGDEARRDVLQHHSGRQMASQYLKLYQDMSRR